MAALWLIVRILLWVLAALLGLVALALFVPITAELRADETGFAAWLRVLFVRIKLYPRPEKEEKPQPEKRKRKNEKTPAPKTKPFPEAAPDRSAPQAAPESEPPEKEKPAPKAAPAPGPAPEKKAKAAQPKSPSLADKLPKDLDRTLALVSTAGGAVRRLLAGLTVHDIDAFLPVHRGSASDTALAVGHVWAAVGAGLGALQNFIRIRPGQITVRPDYTGDEERNASFSCKITGCLFIMVSVGIWAFRRLKEQKFL
ncbi:MAG TPA: DUF2953 domain-containing protein [Candidatus Fournierella excrementigallinarum]|nr:DUF2953 domain-containing protein [Candidatus Fournierella excrementigallinarum]